MGLNYPNYAKTLLETKPEFDDAMRGIPDGTLRTALLFTMQAYVDAGDFWNLCITKHPIFEEDESDDRRRFTEDERARFETYKIPWETVHPWDKSYDMANVSMVGNIWRFAGLMLNTSEALVKQEGEKK
jgi:hypothetical protein